MLCKFYSSCNFDRIFIHFFISDSSHDGRYIVTGGTACILRLWELNLPHEIRFVSEMIGHSRAITSVAFSLNDKQIVSVGEDSSIFIWSLFTN